MTQARPFNTVTTPLVADRIAAKSAAYRAALKKEQDSEIPAAVPGVGTEAIDQAIFEARAAGNWPLIVSLRTRRDELTKQ